MDVLPRRDGRFVDAFNETAKLPSIFRDESRPIDERTWALAYKRLREMDVPEWMGPILFKTEGKPWAYYNDLARQLWDEARHAMMGEVSLVMLGIPFYEYPIPITSSVVLNVDFTPLEAHVLLWQIEQSLMPGSTGKRFERSVAERYGDEFFTALQDYDWADEVLHVQIGRRWLPGRDELQSITNDLMPRFRERVEHVASRSTGREWWGEFVERVRAGGAPDRVRPVE
jgi:hypothetical protein